MSYNIQNKIYGIHWDKTTGEPTRVHDSIGMIAGVGLGDAESYNEFDDAEIYNEIKIVTDTLGNSFTRIPKFYIKKYDGGDYYAKIISKSPISGGYLPKCFWDFTNSKELPYIDVGQYLSAKDGTKMTSKSDTLPERNISIVNWRIAAQANNTGGLLGYQQIDIHTWDVIQTLMDIEFATFNLQAIMAGYIAGQYSASDLLTADTSSNTLQTTNAIAGDYEIGQYIGVGTSQGGFQRFYSKKITNIVADFPGAGQTTITYDGASVDCFIGDFLQNSPWLNGWSSVMNASSGGIGNLTSGKFPIQYRGIENVYGNVYQWVDGINIDGGSTWATTTDYYVGDTVIGNDGSATNDTWICTVDHTSGATTSPTTGADHLTVWANLNGRQSWICEDAESYQSNLFGAPYQKLDYVNLPTYGYIEEEGYDSSYPFANMPIRVGSSSYLRDYYYQSIGARVARVGGDLYSGAIAGVRFWYLSTSSSYTGWIIGGRLLKKALI